MSFLAAIVGSTARLAEERSTIPFPGVEESRALRRDRLLGYSLWCILIVVACIYVELGSRKSVTNHYWGAALNWLAGQPIYGARGVGFIYLPQSAVLFIPFALLPSLVREVLWRVLSIGVLAWGLERLARRAEERSGVPLFGQASAIAAPIAFTCARNGQATLLIAGLMMSSVALSTQGRWWRSAACLVGATALKPITLPLVLLSAVLYRPLAARMGLGFALAALLPSLTQSPGYVASQYQACRQMFVQAARLANVDNFSQLYLLSKTLGLPLSPAQQAFVCLSAATLVLAACIYCRARIEPARWAVHFYSISTTYLMLFNPRTENSTYAMLATVLGIYMVEARVVDRRYGRLSLLSAVAIGILGAYQIGRWVLGPEGANWLAPSMALMFAGYLAARVAEDARPRSNVIDVPLDVEIRPRRAA